MRSCGVEPRREETVATGACLRAEARTGPGQPMLPSFPCGRARGADAARWGL